MTGQNVVPSLFLAVPRWNQNAVPPPSPYRGGNSVVPAAGNTLFPTPNINGRQLARKERHLWPA